MEDISRTHSVSLTKKCGQSSADFSKAFTFRISDRVSLRLYEDTRPHNWKLAKIQKGLILVQNGIERVGEGTGFGFPIIMDAENSYFSRSSRIAVDESSTKTIVRKEFAMDLKSRDRLRNITLQNKGARRLANHIASLYQNHNRLPVLPFKNLLFRAGIKADFIKIEPVGIAEVIYTLREHFANIKASFIASTEIKPEKTFILNELSSRYLRLYTDQHGHLMKDNAIGAWAYVDAEWAALTTLDHAVGFRVWKRRGSILRRGREYMRESMDWVGLDYEITHGRNRFEYDLEILENK